MHMVCTPFIAPRYVYLIVDMSKACERKDLGPASRLDIAVEDCVEFIARFFDQNPLSSVGVIVRLLPRHPGL